MTTIYTSPSMASDPKGVGTHVFIIGVGEYPCLIDGQKGKLLDDPLGLKQLSSPPISARALASWFLGRQGPSPDAAGFHNPSAPLASIEMLLSPSQAYTRPDGETIKVEAATRPNIATCFTQWKERAGAHTDNIAVFYFCGHGVRGANDYLLPSDFGEVNRDNPWVDAIDITATASAMRRLVSGPIYFFIDACRQVSSDAVSPGAGIGALANVDFRKPVCGFTKLILFANGEGLQAFGATGKVSRFTAALIKALSGYEGEAAPDDKGWMVTGDRLGKSVSTILATENKSLKPEKHQHVEKQTVNSQPFHFETVAPRRVYTGISSTWSANPEVRQMLAIWGTDKLVPDYVNEQIAEQIEEGYSEKDESELLSVTDYFDVVLPTMLRWKGEEATKLHKRVRWMLIDQPEKSWTVILEPPEATVVPKDQGHADLLIKITSAAMQAILAGKFNAKKAIADGDIELYGDLSSLKAVGHFFAGSIS